MVQPENTDLLYKGKYHCTIDLQFDRFGFNQASKGVANAGCNVSKAAESKQYHGDTSLTKWVILWYNRTPQNWSPPVTPPEMKNAIPTVAGQVLLFDQWPMIYGPLCASLELYLIK